MKGEPCDAHDWTPAQCCRETAEECDREDLDACIILILSKGKDGKGYENGFRNSGLSMTEALALLEITKSDIIRHMRGEL